MISIQRNSLARSGTLQRICAKINYSHLLAKMLCIKEHSSPTIIYVVNKSITTGSQFSVTVRVDAAFTIFCYFCFSIQELQHLESLVCSLIIGTLLYIV